MFFYVYLRSLLFFNLQLAMFKCQNFFEKIHNFPESLFCFGKFDCTVLSTNAFLDCHTRESGVCFFQAENFEKKEYIFF